LQQSSYTVCCDWAEDCGWFFAPHDPAFREPTDIEQDRLWRFDIPATERQSVVKDLQTFGVNAHSLFGTEETLLEALWEKEHRRALEIDE
jgi:hypothetical protein